MNQKIEKFDEKFIFFLRKYYDEIARLALYIIFFWFGILKVFDTSPAGPLVVDLLQVTFLSFLDPNIFLKYFGIFEMIIGIMILIPKLERITFLVLLFHLFTTAMPLVLLPQEVWNSFLVPNLTGQYIIKNIALLSLGLVLFAKLKPMTQTHSIKGVQQN